MGVATRRGSESAELELARTTVHGKFPRQPRTAGCGRNQSVVSDRLRLWPPFASAPNGHHLCPVMDRDRLELAAAALKRHALAQI